MKTAVQKAESPRLSAIASGRLVSRVASAPAKVVRTRDGATPRLRPKAAKKNTAPMTRATPRHGTMPIGSVGRPSAESAMTMPKPTRTRPSTAGK